MIFLKDNLPRPIGQVSFNQERFPFFPELSAQAIPIVMRISPLIKRSSQISQILNSMHEGNSFSSKPLGKSLFNFQNNRSSLGPTSQFRLLESGLKVTCPGKKIYLLTPDYQTVLFQAQAPSLRVEREVFV